MLRILGLLAFVTLWPCATAVAANSSAALTGIVSSLAEGPMEGVLVKAKRAGSIVTVTVVSDQRGVFAFPKDKLPQGKYSLNVRAVGYELREPLTVDLAQDARKLDLQLQKTADLASQLSNSEWLMSIPGSRSQIMSVYNCVHCHSLTGIMQSNNDDKGWAAFLPVMQTFGRSAALPREQKKGSPLSFQLQPEESFTRFLAAIDLSAGPRKYQLKTLPRPSGPATRVVITEYDVPEGTQPHEVRPAPDGTIWYSDFTGQSLYKLDPKSEQWTRYQMPDLKPNAPAGSNFLEIDKHGNFWLAGLAQSAIFEFDRNTEQFRTWKQPDFASPHSYVGSIALTPQGDVWCADTAQNDVYKLDPKSGFEKYQPFPGPKVVPSLAALGYMGGVREPMHAMYGSAADSRGNAYIADIGAANIVRIDSKTGKSQLFPTPTPDSGPRRMYMDNADRLWFGEYYAGKIGMFDTKTEQFKEWSIPVPNAGPYDVQVDKNGDVWSGGMHTDLLYRLNPRTGKFVSYLLPSLNVNIRNMKGVDNGSTPMAVWVGENLQGKIAKVEPLD